MGGNPNIAQLAPWIVLQPHQPNVGATQQPLPPAVQQLSLPAPPQPNVQQGGSSSSSSSGNFQFPQGSARLAYEEPQRRQRTRLTKKTNPKESAREDTDAPREEGNMRPMTKPRKIGIQKLRETFEEANNKNTINTSTCRKYRSLYNKWVSCVPAGKNKP